MTVCMLLILSMSAAGLITAQENSSYTVETLDITFFGKPKVI